MENNLSVNQQRGEIEIDLVEIFHIILRRLPLILFSALAVALAVFLYSRYFATPKYVSSTKLYVLPRSGNSSKESALTQQDLQIGSMITKDYEQLVKTRDIAQRVIAKLDLRNAKGEFVDSNTILRAVSVSSQDNSRVVTISVTDDDPYEAHDIAEAVCDAAAEHIQAVTSSESVNIVDKASMPTSPSSPNVRRNALIGAMVGLLLSILGIIIAHLSNDSIKNSDDIEKYLQLSTLGSIPISKEVEKGRAARIRRSKIKQKNNQITLKKGKTT